MAVIAVEGPSFSGKTTLIRTLVGRGARSVAELADDFNGGATFPHAHDEWSLWEQDVWFADQEQARWHRAEESNTADVPVFMDRCLLSVLIHVAVRGQLTHRPADPRFVAHLTVAAREGRLAIPPLVLVSVPSTVRSARRAVRGPDVSRLSFEQSDAFLDAADRLYQRVAAALPNTSVCVVRGDGDLDQAADRAEGFAAACHQRGAEIIPLRTILDLLQEGLDA